MRTTVEIPDELFRRAKAQAALAGRRFKDLVAEALRRYLEAPDAGPVRAKEEPSVHDLMKDLCGIVEDAPPDLSSNPKHLEGFGR